MTITGWEIRQARRLLGWRRLDLGRHALLTVPLIDAVESSDGVAWLSRDQENALRSALEAAGVEFTPGDDGGVRLRKATMDHGSSE